MAYGIPHQENMSVKCILRQTPLLCSKTVVYMSIPIFSLLIQHIAVLMCTHNQCFQQKMLKISIFFLLKIFIFHNSLKSLFILYFTVKTNVYQNLIKLVFSLI